MPTDALPPPRRPLVERALLLAVLLTYAMGGYYLIGLATDPARGASLRTPLDDAIPFSPLWMYVYAWVYTSMALPIFVIRCPRLFRRVAVAYVACLTLSMIVWALFPVSAHTLRPDVSGLPIDSFHHWGIRFNYSLDPPTNLFPSLHLSIAVLSGLAAWKARPAYGWIALSLAALIGYAICAVKQHYALDGLAGAALAAGLYWRLVHPYRPPAEEPEPGLAYPWWSFGMYLAFHASVYGGLFMAYKLGVRTW